MTEAIRTDNTETLVNALNRIAKLEKENAELKERLEHRNCVDCSNYGSNIKLLKAKKIIKELMKMPILLVAEETKTETEIEELFKQAEDFIKELDK